MVTRSNGATPGTAEQRRQRLWVVRRFRGTRRGPEPALRSFGGEERVARPDDAIPGPDAPVSVHLADARREQRHSIRAINVGQYRNPWLHLQPPK